MPISVHHKTDRAPVKMWLPQLDVENAAMQQIENTASLPFIFKHLAIMPDAHYGIGATVGSVVATKGAIVPACVGVDIGCGMMAAKLPYQANHLPDNLRGLFDAISAIVPVGFAMHDNPCSSDQWDELVFGYLQLPESISQDSNRVQRQLGTLGGGNHFIEVCLDLNDQVWIMLHSGSRGIGNKIGSYYIEQAKKIMDAYMIKLLDPNLAYLADGTEMFNAYWRDLQWAQAYAMENRQMMMRLVLHALSHTCFEGAPIVPELTVNCHHNYAERENHYGENVLVTRKGAVRARVGDMGIIPGSMGTKSYIVEGLGNAESFCSCSHGAGRTMSRAAANKRFTIDDAILQTKGIMCKKDASIIDELPGAYKDIDQVMENQKDLVKIVAQLRQVLCVKG
jgi:tRNA-splicing ligase RtcB